MSGDERGEANEDQPVAADDEEREIAETLGRRERQMGWALLSGGAVVFLVGLGLAFFFHDSMFPALAGGALGSVLFGVWRQREARRTFAFARGQKGAGDETPPASGD